MKVTNQVKSTLIRNSHVLDTDKSVVMTFFLFFVCFTDLTRMLCVFFNKKTKKIFSTNDLFVCKMKWNEMKKLTTNRNKYSVWIIICRRCTVVCSCLLHSLLDNCACYRWFYIIWWMFIIPASIYRHAKRIRSTSQRAFDILTFSLCTHTHFFLTVSRGNLWIFAVVWGIFVLRGCCKVLAFYYVGCRCCARRESKRFA